MQSYLVSKPPSTVEPAWLNWTAKDYKSLDPESNQIATLVYITQKKNVCTIYKSMPVKNDDGTLSGIIGNMLDEKTTPTFIKIEGEDIGSCCIIHYMDDIPPTHRPEIPLSADILKDTVWKKSDKDLALCMIPMLAPIPYSKGIESTVFDDDFINEMEKMLRAHGFWARMMSNAIEQAETESDVSTIVKSMQVTRTSSHCDPCYAATKGFRQAFIPTSGPFVEVSSVRQKHEAEQAILRSFFERDPTPI